MLIALLAACTLSSPEPQAAVDLPVPIAAGAKAQLGQAAPDFALPALDGSVHKLSDHAGKVVVLEWFNPGCPFVKAAYKDEVLPTLQQRYADNDEVVWLVINSGAEGKQGAGLDENQRAAKKWDITGPVLRDQSGAVGMAYSAKTTPQIVVVDREGVVRFNGALDNAPLSKADGGTRVPYGEQAIDAVLAGGDVENASPKPWGCSVKYAQ